MRDYKHVSQMQDELYEPLEMDRTTRVLIAMLVLALVAMLVNGLFEALDRTAEIQERYYSAPVTATFERPAAYRLASPTMEQMDHVEALLVVQQVAR
jgi:hypothetical protein